MLQLAYMYPQHYRLELCKIASPWEPLTSVPDVTALPIIGCAIFYLKRNSFRRSRSQIEWRP